MSRRPFSSWSKRGLICYYVGLIILFMATFFLPVLGNPDTTMGRKDVVYGYDAAATSWHLFFNSYDDVYKALVPSQAVRESVSDKTIIATFLLYGSRMDEAGSKDFSGKLSKPLVYVYSICLQFAWLCNAIPVLLLLQMVFRAEGPWRKLLIFSSYFLFIIGISFLVLQLLAWSWPILGMSGASGYLFWIATLASLSPISKEQRKAWPYSCGQEARESAGSA